MSLPNPNEFDYANRGEPLPVLSGGTSTADFDYSSLGQVIPAFVAGVVSPPPLAPTQILQQLRPVASRFA